VRENSQGTALRELLAAISSSSGSSCTRGAGLQSHKDDGGGEGCGYTGSTRAVSRHRLQGRRARHASSSSLPRSLDRALRGRASRASRRRHQLQVLCRRDVGERRGDSRPWQWHDAVQRVRVVQAQHSSVCCKARS
jgi:hypothetical protein